MPPTALIWSAVIVYPIGVTVFCALLLRSASTDIKATGQTGLEHGTLLSRAIGFLHDEYNVTFFWWELMEMGRKFLLIGLFVTVAPGSIIQITIGTIFSAFFLLVSYATVA